jgi:hypothetical protein
MYIGAHHNKKGNAMQRSMTPKIPQSIFNTAFARLEAKVVKPQLFRLG